MPCDRGNIHLYTGGFAPGHRVDDYLGELSHVCGDAPAWGDRDRVAQRHPLSHPPLPETLPSRWTRSDRGRNSQDLWIGVSCDLLIAS